MHFSKCWALERDRSTRRIRSNVPSLKIQTERPRERWGDAGDTAMPG